MKKKISIIVPVFNCAQYLKACLDSLINLQAVNELEVEIVVVDDGRQITLLRYVITMLKNMAMYLFFTRLIKV